MLSPDKGASSPSFSEDDSRRHSYTSLPTPSGTVGRSRSTLSTSTLSRLKREYGLRFPKGQREGGKGEKTRSLGHIRHQVTLAALRPYKRKGDITLEDVKRVAERLSVPGPHEGRVFRVVSTAEWMDRFYLAAVEYFHHFLDLVAEKRRFRFEVERPVIPVLVRAVKELAGAVRGRGSKGVLERGVETLVAHGAAPFLYPFPDGDLDVVDLVLDECLGVLEAETHRSHRQAKKSLNSMWKNREEEKLRHLAEKEALERRVQRGLEKFSESYCSLLLRKEFGDLGAGRSKVLARFTALVAWVALERRDLSSIDKELDSLLGIAGRHGRKKDLPVSELVHVELQRRKRFLGRGSEAKEESPSPESPPAHLGILGRKCCEFNGDLEPLSDYLSQL
ncbi:unnamed protein product [Darwinula stevensoni]|uniref:Uncharacterized protein n=1 Tax=Darwinula stevensoni TaxID=69355 RepID=A0A7R9A4A8_9CRUS|nr:unnamed protein product [Darwinula stevensoni]CAG0892179.1 unnamed protein product [Darwinula stevensoni]